MPSLVELISKLEVYSKTSSHKQVFDLGQTILKKQKSNVQAFKQCLVSLINLDNYSAAVSFIKEHSLLAESKKSELYLELAYIYYKTDNTENLNDLIPYGQSDRGFQHILAQHYYRIGKDLDALSIYKNLISSNVSSEELDLSVNERAVVSQLKYHNSAEIPEIVSEYHPGSYDELFNEALILIIEKKYTPALELLYRTLDLAKSTLSDYDEDEQFNEIAPIQTQIAYVQLLQSDKEGASQILDLFDTSTIKDKVLKLLLNNNKLSVKSDLSMFNPSLLYRELEFPNSLSLIKPRLTLPQLQILQRNELLLGFLSGKDIKSGARYHESNFPGSVLPSALSSASIKLNHNELLNASPQTAKKLFKHSTKNPDNVPLAILSSQVSIESGNIQNAALLLENLIKNNDLNILNSPALGRLLYAVYEAMDRKTSSSDLLIAIQKKLLAKNNLNNEDIKYAKFIGLKLLTVNEQLGKELLTKIGEIDILQSNFTEIDVDELSSNVDISKLVAGGVAPLLGGFKKPTFTSLNNKIGKQKRIRKQPKKLPKDLERKLDEERWLPLKDRTYYKPKKSKKNKDTQGGPIDAETEQALNINSRSETPVNNTRTSSSNINNKKKNKKKKGKK